MKLYQCPDCKTIRAEPGPDSPTPDRAGDPGLQCCQGPMEPVAWWGPGDPDPHYEGAGPKPRSVLKDPRTLSHLEQFLIADWKEQNGQVSELKLENRTRSKELLMKHLGLLKDHVRMEVASELTMEEEETISKMSDEDLATFRVANEVIERLLHPEEVA